MLPQEKTEKQPYDSIARIFYNWNIQLTEAALKDIAYSVVYGTENALKKPTVEIIKLIRSRHPGAPKLSIGSLARHAMADFNAPSDQGHLDILFVEEPNAPMLQVKKAIFRDTLNKESIMLWIAVNINDQKTHLWRHNHLPDEILLPAIRTFADASVTLAYELHADPTKVLYRSQFPALI